MSISQYGDKGPLLHKICTTYQPASSILIEHLKGYTYSEISDSENVELNFLGDRIIHPNPYREGESYCK